MRLIHVNQYGHTSGIFIAGEVMSFMSVLLLMDMLLLFLFSH